LSSAKPLHTEKVGMMDTMGASLARENKAFSIQRTKNPKIQTGKRPKAPTRIGTHREIGVVRKMMIAMIT
jgi:hypothetical protein